MAGFSDLIKTFKAKAARGTCPWCDANDWTVASGGELFAAVLLSDVEGMTVPDGLEAIPMACKNCGYVQLHLTALLGKDHH